ncbi:MAG: type IV secretory system conjugative DNA transfer family protein [Clostridia bacterium]|nr:type IV secretory system conjugative DNA transfer family protein [Clostridia bacterium]
MENPMTMLIVICLGMFAIIGTLTIISNVYSLNNIKNKRVGHGQHGNARFATEREIKRIYRVVPYRPKLWRKKGGVQDLPQGTVVGMRKRKGEICAVVDEGDVHTLMIGAAGVGKTACFLYPNLEYACASGMSFLSTDTKGDLARSYGNICKDYGYNVAVIDLRNPVRSDSFNMLSMVNKYMDVYARTRNVSDKAKAEKYAKITSKTIIYSGEGDASSYGQNAFFYDAAEGLLTSVILLVAEYCKPEERHIISVFKMIQDLLAPAQAPPGSKKAPTQFQVLMQKLPDTHKAKWFAGAALNTSEQAMQSVLSTALSRLNAFLDSEMEQILCFDTAIDAEMFCNTKSALFLIMPEEDNTKYFLVSLIVQQLYREMLAVADETGGKLKNRVMFYLDEIGTIPKIDSAEMMFSAGRSRRISIIAIIQSLAQLEKNYGKEGASIIIDNCQLTVFGGFAPNSETAETMSKNLGEQTIMSGSVTQSKDSGSKSLQMMSRPLMTVDELKTMRKFHFIVAKTGCNPMRTKLDLFFKWGIELNNNFETDNRSVREVCYAGKEALMAEIEKRVGKMGTASEKASGRYPGGSVYGMAEPEIGFEEFGGDLKANESKNR